MKPRRLPFTLLVPLLALIATSAAILYPALQLYDHLLTAPVINGDIYIGNGVYQALVPRSHLLSWSFHMTALVPSTNLEGANLPGDTLLSLLTSITGHSPHWTPTTNLFLWREIAGFVLCLPAWWFLGFGIDGLLNSRKLRWRSMLVGTVLFLFFLVLGIGFRFGESPQERSELVVPIWSFFFWAAAFAIPPIAWLRQRFARKPQNA